MALDFTIAKNPLPDPDYDLEILTVGNPSEERVQVVKEILDKHANPNSPTVTVSIRPTMRHTLKVSITDRKEEGFDVEIDDRGPTSETDYKMRIDANGDVLKVSQSSGMDDLVVIGYLDAILKTAAQQP